MGRLKAIICTLCISTLCCMGRAQSGTVASGGNETNSSGSISYTIGQIGDTFTKDADGTVSEGIQQPYEIYIITSEDRPYFGSQIQVFPNPTLGELRVLSDANMAEKINYVLLTQDGRILSDGQLSPGQMNIPMSIYPSGTYILSLLSEGQILTSFQVVKTQ